MLKRISIIVLYPLIVLSLDVPIERALGPGIWILGAVDGLLFLHILTQHSLIYAGVNGATQWMWFCWAMAVRLVLCYFAVFKDVDKATVLMEDISFVISLFAAPLMYALWMIRGSTQIFGPSAGATTSVEKFLYSETVFHVVLDLLDISTAFLFGASQYYLTLNDMWITIAIGLVVGLGWFFHAYSYPMSAVSSADSSSPTANETDILLVRRYVALISIFLIDIPLIVFRIIVWIKYPLYPGLQAFIFKNLINIPLSTFRFSQCRQAERERAGGFADEDRSEGRKRLEGLPASSTSLRETIGSPVMPRAADIAVTPDPTQMMLVSPRSFSFSQSGQGLSSQLYDVTDTKLGRSRSGPLTYRQTAALAPPTKTKKPNSLESPPAILESPPARPSGASRDTSHLSADDDLDGSMASPKRLEERGVQKEPVMQLIHHLEMIRSIPVLAFGFWHVMGRVWKALCFGWSQGVPARLPMMNKLRKSHKIRLAIMYMWLTSSRILLANYSVRFRECTKYPNFEGRCNQYFILLMVAVGLQFVLSIGMYAQLAPWAEVIWSGVYTAVRTMAFVLLLTGINGSGSLTGVQAAVGGDSDDANELLGGILMTLFFLYPFLRGIYYFFLSFSQKDYLYFPFPKIRSPMTVDEEQELYPRVAWQVEEENGIMSFSTMLIWLNCTERLAPANFHALLMGPELIKSIRLTDVMIMKDWGRLGFWVMVAGLTIAAHPHLGTTILFIVKIMLDLCHLFWSQSTRLIALRKYELQATLSALIERRNTLGADVTDTLIGTGKSADFGVHTPSESFRDVVLLERLEKLSLNQVRPPVV